MLNRILPRPAHWAGGASIALLAGCSSWAPCDHRNLESRYALTCVLVGYRDQPKGDERGCLLGTVAAEPSDAPIVVFAYQQRGETVEVIESSVLFRPGQYSFAVPAGAYHVAAFVDDDGDLRYDPAREPAALYHGGRTVAVMPGHRVDRLNLKVRREQPQHIEFTFSVPASGISSPADQRCTSPST